MGGKELTPALLLPTTNNDNTIDDRITTIASINNKYKGTPNDREIINASTTTTNNESNAAEDTTVAANDDDEYVDTDDEEYVDAEDEEYIDNIERPNIIQDTTIAKTDSHDLLDDSFFFVRSIP